MSSESKAARNTGSDIEKIEISRKCEEMRKVPPYLKKYFGDTNIRFDSDVESIDEWTGNIRPSDANIFSFLNTEWIRVKNPVEVERHIRKYRPEEYDFHLKTLEKSMEFLPPYQYKGAVHKCTQKIREIAIKQRVVCGKWMVVGTKWMKSGRRSQGQLLMEV